MAFVIGLYCPSTLLELFLLFFIYAVAVSRHCLIAFICLFVYLLFCHLVYHLGAPFSLGFALCLYCTPYFICIYAIVPVPLFATLSLRLLYFNFLILIFIFYYFIIAVRYPINWNFRMAYGLLDSSSY